MTEFPVHGENVVHGIGNFDVRYSSKIIANKSKHVKIVGEGISALSDYIFASLAHDKDSATFYSSNLHPSGEDESKACDWVFFLATLNFSFWTSETEDPFVVTDDCGIQQTGYCGFCACVTRAMKQGVPLIEPSYYVTVSLESLREIFTADNGRVIPMLEERHQNLAEAGCVLLEKFGGSFYNCVKLCGKSALSLLQLVVANFDSFRDFAFYGGQQVAFLKRAQILVQDLWSCLKGKAIAEFADIDVLTMFADYRVPQVLLHYHALEYSAELLAVLNSKKIIPSGDIMEIEIRGCSIEAVEIVDLLNAKFIERDCARRVNAGLVDYFLWSYRRKHASDLESVPFHRVHHCFNTMFKKFNEKEHVSGFQQLKSTVQKSIRAQLLENFPYLENYLEEILPKKEQFKVIKCQDHVEIIADSKGDLLFFKSRDGPFIPTLRLLHQYPFILPPQQVDRGAIKFVLSGANIMCPGLTSAGAKLIPGVEKDKIVAIMAEGKDHALAIGRMEMSSNDVKQINKGIGIENVHFLNDGLWLMKPMKI